MRLVLPSARPSCFLQTQAARWGPGPPQLGLIPAPSSSSGGGAAARNPAWALARHTCPARALPQPCHAVTPALGRQQGWPRDGEGPRIRTPKAERLPLPASGLWALPALPTAHLSHGSPGLPAPGIGRHGNPAFAGLVSNDLLACVVICRAWQAELGELVGFGWRRRHTSSRPTLSSSCRLISGVREIRASCLGSIGSLRAPETETDVQTDVEHSCSPVRQRRAGNSRVHPWQVRAPGFPDAPLPAPCAPSRCLGEGSREGWWPGRRRDASRQRPGKRRIAQVERPSNQRGRDERGPDTLHFSSAKLIPASKAVPGLRR